MVAAVSYNKYISIQKQIKKMTYATRANGRRAAHERSKQKDLNELDLEFTQILLPVQTLRSLSVTCKEGRKVVDQQF